MPQIVIVGDRSEGGHVAAELIEQRLSDKHDLVLGVATGSTPVSIWEHLEHRGLELQELTAFALDEYLGLPPGHPQSYAAEVDRQVTRRLGLDPRRVHTPSGRGCPGDPDRYEDAIRDAGGIDIQILGIGTNGHIGFNEPGADPRGATHLADLTEQTRRDNARFFGSLDEVPSRCITQGIGTIMRARELVLVAYGEHKAAALAAALHGTVDAAVPASVLQRHPRVTVIADWAAAASLRVAKAG